MPNIKDRLLTRAILIPVICWLGTSLGAPGEPAEGRLASFLGEPQMELQQLFTGERFPNVVVTVRGTVLAALGNKSVRVRRSEDGGRTWGEEITMANPGFHGGGLTVDETTGAIFGFVQAHHPPAPLTVYRSRDDGKTWQQDEGVKVHPDSRGNVLAMHMNEHGITLRHGAHLGRLLRPARWFAPADKPTEWPHGYTTAIYSDDGGATWQASEPFGALGTGEAAVAELADGRIYYNSRRHWAPEGMNARKRWTAWSTDGGATWSAPTLCEVLPDGPQDTDYGCMGGLVRLPVKDRDILVYSNCDSPSGRRRGTVWASFDGGRTWPVKRLVHEGSFAYSSLNAGRPGTGSEGWLYLHFESGGSKMARFNLAWLRRGEPTGDGEIPKWLADK